MTDGESLYACIITMTVFQGLIVFFMILMMLIILGYLVTNSSKKTIKPRQYTTQLE